MRLDAQPGSMKQPVASVWEPYFDPPREGLKLRLGSTIMEHAEPGCGVRRGVFDQDEQRPTLDIRPHVHLPREDESLCTFSVP